MEVCKDIQPLTSEFETIQGACITKNGISGSNEPSDSILKERRRRKEISEKFSVLRSMVPRLLAISKPTRDEILHDSVNYIQSLEEEIKRLEEIKKLRDDEQNGGQLVLSRCTKQKSAVDVAISSGAIYFAIQLPFKRGIITNIVKVFDKYHAEILEATVSVDEHRLLTFTVTIVVGRDGDGVMQKIKEEIVAL